MSDRTASSEPSTTAFALSGRRTNSERQPIESSSRVQPRSVSHSVRTSRACEPSPITTSADTARVPGESLRGGELSMGCRAWDTSPPSQEPSPRESSAAAAAAGDLERRAAERIRAAADALPTGARPPGRAERRWAATGAERRSYDDVSCSGEASGSVVVATVVVRSRRGVVLRARLGVERRPASSSAASSAACSAADRRSRSSSRRGVPSSGVRLPSWWWSSWWRSWSVVVVVVVVAVVDQVVGVDHVERVVVLEPVRRLLDRVLRSDHARRVVVQPVQAVLGRVERRHQEALFFSPPPSPSARRGEVWRWWWPRWWPWRWPSVLRGVGERVRWWRWWWV